MWDCEDFCGAKNPIGEDCSECGATVRKKVLAGRSTYYCPRCQH